MLTVTEMLRKQGVVGKFVEFYGPGISELPLADRATIGNMAPEYGATCGIFPVDAETLRYLRSPAAAKSRSRWSRPTTKSRACSTRRMRRRRSTPRRFARSGHGRAERRRAQASAGSRRALSEAACELSRSSLPALLGPNASANGERQVVRWEGEGGHPSANGKYATPKARPEPGQRSHRCKSASASISDKYLDHGSIVIAAITSCTNTSNPYVMIAAGLLAKKAVEKGLNVPPWVKTSLAPGSRVVTDYYDKAGLLAVSRQAALQRRRLWLHHLHRQLRPAADRCFASRSKTTGSWRSPCSAAIATSKAASIPKCARITSCRRRWWWPMRWPGTSITTSTTTRWAKTRTASPSTCATSGRRRKRSQTRLPPPSIRACSASNMPR